MGVSNSQSEQRETMSVFAKLNRTRKHEKKTIVFDFDGVIHSYTSGWKGIDIIPDKPTDGISEVIRNIRNKGFEVVIVSTRCVEDKGINAIKRFLSDNNIEVDGIMANKPPALVYVDDRAICFNGDTADLEERICNFKSWVE